MVKARAASVKKAALAAMISLAMLAGCAEKTYAEKAGGKIVYPAGTAVIYGYGQPQYLKQYFDAWLERNRDIAPNVKIEIVQTEGAASSREKITMTWLAGAYDDLPDAAYIDPVNLKDLAKGGILKDETDFVTPLIGQMVSGATEDGKYKGKLYGLPESVRPQLLFYNKAILDKYGINPASMSTMEGYIEAGRQLKEKSGGKVYLSYVDPGSLTWRYWGRRGLMPQAKARIWDENGNVVIGADKGTALALGTLERMNQEGLLFKSAIMQPALYDSMRKGEVATFYIGAFWDEFMRKNVSETSGQWRAMPAPTFAGIGKAGAPVSNYFTVLNKPKGKYSGLMEKLWKDFQFDNGPRKEWVNKMVAQNAPYANPISLEMLKDPFWKEPSAFYGNQSFREMEGKGLENASTNLSITPQDAEADKIISAELERYIAGDQSMKQAIANMDKNLKSKIGKAETAK